MNRNVPPAPSGSSTGWCRSCLASLAKRRLGLPSENAQFFGEFLRVSDLALGLISGGLQPALSLVSILELFPNL